MKKATEAGIDKKWQQSTGGDKNSKNSNTNQLVSHL